MAVARIVRRGVPHQALVAACLPWGASRPEPVLVATRSEYGYASALVLERLSCGV